MPDVSVTIDTKEILASLNRVGNRAQGLALAQAFRTASAIKSAAQSMIAKRRPYTYSLIVFEPTRRGNGYVVMMTDQYKDGTAPARHRSNRNRGALKYKQEKHVGLWLEFGTNRMRPRPWLFPAASTQEQPYLAGLAESLERAIREEGF